MGRKIHICKCGAKFTDPITYPVKCCPNPELTEIENPKPFFSSLDCSHRGGVIGSVDCNCQGIREVFSCEIHEVCMIRKLKPYTRFEGKEPKFCNSCEDRDG